MQIQEVKHVLAKPSIHWLAIFLPISLAVAYLPKFQNEIVLFFTSCLGMVVVAYWLGNATEELAARVGSVWGGMMNAAFSNLPELIFGLIAAALIGSVLIMTQISQDGRCNWLNGLQMLIFFGVIAVLFFYDPT